MMEPLMLFLVAPIGYEHMATVVVATSRIDAEEKVSTKDKIKQLTEDGVQLIAVNITTSLAAQGYNVDVSKTGMFH